MRTLAALLVCVSLGCGKKDPPEPEPKHSETPAVPAPKQVEVRPDVALVGAYVRGGHLAVMIGVTTTNDRRQFKFEGWTGRHEVLAKDDAGNEYQPVRGSLIEENMLPDVWAAFAEKRKSTLRYGPGSVTAAAGRVEIIQFPEPPRGVAAIVVQLPTEYVGIESLTPFLVSVPRAAWDRPAEK